MGESELQSMTDGAWRAEAVRHQVLIRALPVQRHDMLGPLAVARMALGLLQRRLDAGTCDEPRLRSKLAEADQQVAEAVQAVAALRWWDDQHAERRDLLVCADQCTALVSLPMGLRGHRLLPAMRGGELAPDDAPPQVAAPAVHYALLAVLMHAQDTLTAPHACQWQVGLDSLVLQATPLPSAPAEGASVLDAGLLPSGADAGATAPPMLASPRRLDARALGWLMADLGWSCHRGPQGWTLRWADDGD